MEEIQTKIVKKKTELEYRHESIEEAICGFFKQPCLY